VTLIVVGDAAVEGVERVAEWYGAGVDGQTDERPEKTVFDQVSTVAVATQPCEKGTERGAMRLEGALRHVRHHSN
jgi:hypothetical protein